VEVETLIHQAPLLLRGVLVAVMLQAMVQRLVKVYLGRVILAALGIQAVLEAVLVAVELEL
jgi:hypothetical protein